MSEDAEKGAVPTPAFAPWDDPQAKPLIRFQGVTKKFGEFVAIDDLSLDIYEREFFALLGPSGCGKTTLMRMLAGFENPSMGGITLAGRDIVPVPPNKRPVNMMFQSYALFPHLSVADNIAFGLKRSDMAKSEIAGRVDEMLGLVQLRKFAARKPHQISGGQRQRVALARALAKAPKLLLLDEPLGALDRKLREETQFELMDIQEKLGTTFVIVTHDQEEAMTVASRVAVMDNGRLVQVDTPERIYEFPVSRYVADFIGDVNLIEGRIETLTKDCATVVWAETMPPITAGLPQGIGAGEACVFAIRPEKVTISAERPPDAVNALPGKVLDIGYLGNMSTYHVELANGQVIKSQMTNQRRLARRAFSWEDQVWVSFTATGGLILMA
ncbi:MAG: ABC transporter ATP-binding protein [Rhodobacteraceae bacterium]|nr:ABC transporter ATP-binding protein [Paracoccaceae bacterium]